MPNQLADQAKVEIAARKYRNRVQNIYRNYTRLASIIEFGLRYQITGATSYNNVTTRDMERLTVIDEMLSGASDSLRAMLRLYPVPERSNVGIYVETMGDDFGVVYVGPFVDRKVATLYGEQWQENNDDNPSWNVVELAHDKNGNVVVDIEDPSKCETSELLRGPFLRVIRRVQPYTRNLMVSYIGPFRNDSEAYGYGLHMSRMNNIEWQVVHLDTDITSFPPIVTIPN